MTYSIAAYDPKNKEWGIAVQSKFVAVGAIVPFARANVGAIATQAYVNTSYGPKGLELLEKGLAAQEVVEILTKNDNNKESRQVGVVDKNGNTASFTGQDCYNWAGHYIGENFCCQGNILASDKVLKNMVSAFENTKGDLIERLFATLEGAQGAGGDKRGMESAAILIVKEKGAYDGGTDRYIDIRVDEHPSPIDELHKVFEIYDLCILNRDDPKDIVELKAEALDNVQTILINEGFYSGEKQAIFTDDLRESLIKWMHTNNFEVKERSDNFLFGSVYRYILNQLKK